MTMIIMITCKCIVLLHSHQVLLTEGEHMEKPPPTVRPRAQRRLSSDAVLLEIKVVLF